MGLSADDLWTPDQPLPGARVLGRLVARCAEAWQEPWLARRARVGYNARLRSTLGRALLDDGRVELNPRLLAEHPEQLVPTLVHELAHLVVHRRYGRVAPHGPHFRALMRSLNLDPGAHHHLPTEHLRQRRRRYLYLHRCDRCGVTFVARRVRRDCYCRACGPDMTWDVWRAPATPQGRELLRQLQAGEATEA